MMGFNGHHTNGHRSSVAARGISAWRTSPPSLSFVIPVKDEESTITPLFEQIIEQAKKITSFWEIIFIDDGSTDNSWPIIQSLAQLYPSYIKAIRFRRNIGKADALAAGWKVSSGDFVFTMDADLQDDPKEIPRFLNKIYEGYDVVTGWKKTRHDPWHKVLPSRIFNYILSRVNKVELHDHNCGFKCYRREVVQSLPMYGEMHRMVPALAAIQGFQTAEIPVKHHPRLHGRSKYGIKRFLRGFLDMWTVHFLQNFRQRPMHLMGRVSLLMLGTACCLALFLARAPQLPLSLFLLLSSALTALLLGAVLTTMIGLLAEWNVYQSIEYARSRPISETIGMERATHGNVTDNGAVAIRQQPTAQFFNTTIGNGHPTALVLDYDTAVRNATTTNLRQANWNVLTATSLDEAHRKLQQPIELLLLNPSISSGKMDVLDAFIQLTQKLPMPPAIVLLPAASVATNHGDHPVHIGNNSPHFLLEIALQAVVNHRQNNGAPN
jgi:CheY-like chemotaxis protein